MVLVHDAEFAGRPHDADVVQRGHKDVGDEGIDAVFVASTSELGAQRILVEGEDGVEDAPAHLGREDVVRLQIHRQINISRGPAGARCHSSCAAWSFAVRCSLFAVRCLPEPRVSRLVA